MDNPDGITVNEWHQMAQSDLREDGSRIELLDGELVEVPPVGEQYTSCVSRLSGIFESEIGDRGVVSIQGPVHLDDRSEPRPAIAILSPRADGYTAGLPTASDILLVVEVSDNWIALGYDRGRKAAYYARCGVPECWVVDLLSDQVLLMRSPASGGYRDQRNIRRGASPLVVASLEGLAVEVEDILGY